MKYLNKLLAFAAIALLAAPALAQTHNGPCYRTSDKWTIGTGCTLEVTGDGVLSLPGGDAEGSKNFTGDVTISGGSDLIMSGTTGQSKFKMVDNLANALEVTEGANGYLSFTTTDASEAINVKKNTILTDGITIVNSANTTGSSIWGASDKGGFFGATPVVKPTSTTDLRTALINLGLYTTGGASPLDLNGGAASVGALTTTGVITVDTVVVNRKALSLPGRVDITICGDGTTINNNTVYYGPSMVPVANGVRTCDTTQAGNVTEATADAPALDNTAIQVLSMDCLTADPGASGVDFTLRNNAGATVPSVTCSVANTKLGCTANVQTTTAIAAGNPIAIAAHSGGNQGTTPFACTIHAAY